VEKRGADSNLAIVLKSSTSRRGGRGDNLANPVGGKKKETLNNPNRRGEKDL